MKVTKRNTKDSETPNFVKLRTVAEISYELKIVRNLLVGDKTLPDDCKLILRTWLLALKWMLGRNKKGH